MQTRFHMIFFASALFFAAACHDAQSPSSAPQPSSPASDAPMSCTKDSDCQAPGCGPCASGSKISRADIEKECVTNVCTTFVDDAGERTQRPAPEAICSAKHVCVIK